MRIALPIHNHRLAPVFDVAGRLMVLRIEGEERQLEGLWPLPVDEPAIAKVQRLINEGIDVLICGAISQSAQAYALSRGIRVHGFVRGEVEQVLEAWQQGRLSQTDFVMPGCGLGRGRGQRRRLRRGRGNCRQAGDTADNFETNNLKGE